MTSTAPKYRYLGLGSYLEFQSRADPWMAVRMDVYVALLSQDLISRNELAPSGKLPPILPIVLYHSKRRWNAATTLARLIASMPSNLRTFQPAQKYLLIDAHTRDIASLDVTNNLLTAIFRVQRANAGEAREIVPQIMGGLVSRFSGPQHLTLRQHLTVFFHGLLQRQFPGLTIPEVPDLPELSAMFNERFATWEDELKHEGRVEGEERGRIEGRVQGEAQVLRRQLKRRFGTLPDWVETKLTAATEADLLHWSENVVDARSLGEIFVP